MLFFYLLVVSSCVARVISKLSDSISLTYILIENSDRFWLNSRVLRSVVIEELYSINKKTMVTTYS